MNKGKIILLNGVSSSGKTTLSKELVIKSPDYFHLSLDDFDIFIERMEDRASKRLIPVPTEHYFHRTIAMFSDSGVNLIVDHILHDKKTTRDCFATLHSFPVFFVGVHCPLTELERREQLRGERNIGQAKEQLEYVHQQNEIYDVEIDTYRDSIESCVNLIRDLNDASNYPKAWLATIEKHNHI